MLECGAAPMTSYAHAVAVYFTGTVRQTCYDFIFIYFLWLISMGHSHPTNVAIKSATRPPVTVYTLAKSGSSIQVDARLIDASRIVIV